jgi:hypothetical protein
VQLRDAHPRDHSSAILDCGPRQQPKRRRADNIGGFIAVIEEDELDIVLVQELGKQHRTIHRPTDAIDCGERDEADPSRNRRDGSFDGEEVWALVEPAKANQIVRNDDLAQTPAATVKSCQRVKLSINRNDTAGSAGDTNPFPAGIAQKARHRASVGEADGRKCLPLTTVEDRRFRRVDVTCCAHDGKHSAPLVCAAAFSLRASP